MTMMPADITTTTSCPECGHEVPIMLPRGANITACPTCGTGCKTIKTRQIVPTYREITFLCPNPRCGHLFVAAITPVRTLEPSALAPQEVEKKG